MFEDDFMGTSRVGHRMLALFFLSLLLLSSYSCASSPFSLSLSLPVFFFFFPFWLDCWPVLLHSEGASFGLLTRRWSYGSMTATPDAGGRRSYWRSASKKDGKEEEEEEEEGEGEGEEEERAGEIENPTHPVPDRVARKCSSSTCSPLVWFLWKTESKSRDFWGQKGSRKKKDFYFKYVFNILLLHFLSFLNRSWR